MIKHAIAIRLGAASTEAILRRFTRIHPAYAPMLKLGRAQRTLFSARWLRDRDLQRETTAALNTENGVNDYIHFGKSGELASNRPQGTRKIDDLSTDWQSQPRIREHPDAAMHSR